MSTSLLLNNNTISNFKKKFQIKSKNRYASSDIKVLMSKYKEKQIYDTVNEKLSDIKNLKTINNSNNEPNEGHTTLTTSTDFKITNNFRKNLRFKFKNYNSHTYNHFNKQQKIKEVEYQENQTDKEGDLNNKEYINNYFSRYKQAETIYTILNQKTKKYFENLNKYVHRVNKSQKKIIFGLSPFPNISVNRELRFQDSTNKSVTLYNKSFGSAAIGERYERHMSELLKLKQILKNIKEKDDKKREEYIHRMLSNYLAQNGIFDIKYYKPQYLSNFKDFLEIEFDVQPRIPYKQFLFNILFGHYDKYYHNPMDSNNSSLAYFKRNNQLKRGFSFESDISNSKKNSTINASRRSSNSIFEKYYENISGENMENTHEKKEINLYKHKF